MDRITTTDLYEGSFYVTRGFELDAVACIPVNGKPVCQFTFTGPTILDANRRYMTHEANVNLLDFRRAYSQLSQVMAEAKRTYKTHVAKA